LIGVALLMIAVYLSTYFFQDEVINYKEQPYDELILDEKFYSPSETEDWHILELGYFTIETPVSYQFFKLRGFDSYVGGITNLTDTLYFDFGEYSNNFSEYNHLQGFHMLNEILNSKKIKIVRELKSKGFVAAYTNDLKNSNTFSIYCSGCHDLDEKVQIIKTLKFEN